MTVSRRAFLGMAGGAAGAAVGGGVLWSRLVADQLEQTSGPAATPGTASGTSMLLDAATAGRVLVVLQLSGGNDGLNTVVPVGDGRYFDARPTLRVAEGDALALRGAPGFGFHPALAPLLPTWEAGQLAVVDGVGLPGQTRSHFAAMDAWWSADPGHPRTTGWLGRWLDRTGDAANPLRAISLGGGSPALVGERSLSTVVLDPAAFALRTPKGADASMVRDAFLATAEPLSSSPALAAAQRAVPASLDAVDLLARATQSGAQPSDEFVKASKSKDNNLGVTELLATAAGIIELDIGTQVIVVAVSGFDTHADQARRHAQLLDDTAGGLAAFLARLGSSGHADRVLVMTTSEFGRRVAENGGGTDHGNGGLQLFAGPMVKGGQIVGGTDLGTLDEGDVRATLDTRSLYASALDWLGGPTDEILGGTRWDRLGLLAA